jgi:hypothetical protein
MMMNKPALIGLRNVALILITCAAGITACVQAGTLTTPSAPASPPAATPSVFFPTLIPSPTITFLPTQSATLAHSDGQGEVIFMDNFSIERGWIPAELAPGGMSRSSDGLTLSVRQANSLYMALSPTDPIQNALIEVDVRPALCSSNDEFGLVFRINENFEHYRFVLTCMGEARVVGVIGGVERVLVPSTGSTSIFPGVYLSNRLGVSMDGNDFRFFINGQEVFFDRDLSLVSGHIGLVVRARQSGQTTASFDNFIIRMLQPKPTTTATD